MEKVKKGADRPENRHTGGGPDDGGRGSGSRLSATTILMPTVIPLIPGGSLYYAMDAALRHDAPEFILKAQKAIGLAVALAAGIMIVTSLRRPIEAVMHVIKRKQLTNKCS